MIDFLNTTLIFIDGDGKSFTENEQIIELMLKIGKFKKVKHLSSSFDVKSNNSEIIQIDKLNYSEYNRFCIWNLNSYIDTDYAFLMQSDGFIINPQLFSNKFFEYDYIGAPWCPNLFSSSLGQHPAYVGNGGFCIRSKKLLNLCSKLNPDINLPCNEDCFIGITLKNYFENNSCSFAPYEIAKNFAVEMGCDENHNLETSFGFHGKPSVHKAHYILQKNICNYVNT